MNGRIRGAVPDGVAEDWGGGKYSELVLDEIVAVEDRGALVVDGCGDFKCFGTALRFRGAVRSPIEAAAEHLAAADDGRCDEERLKRKR